jgi:Circularly permutated YpsA SLOG family
MKLRFFLNLLDNVTMAQLYVLRSQKNVQDSDGTIAFRLVQSVGTDKTIGYCLTKKWKSVSSFNVSTSYKPCFVVTSFSDPENIVNIQNFIDRNKIVVLNIAGHRDEIIEGFSEEITKLLVEALGSRCRRR